jgi:hypothetical protein
MGSPPRLNPEDISAPNPVVISSIKQTPEFKNRTYLYEKYVIQGLTPGQIAKEILSARSSVLKYLRIYNIPLRPADEESTRRRPPAFGERRLSGKVVTNILELRVVEMMKDLRSEGLSYWKVAERLNQLKIPTKTSKGPLQHCP